MSNQQFEGCIKKSRLPYYDIVSGNIKFKARPVLLIKAEKTKVPAILQYYRCRLLV